MTKAPGAAPTPRMNLKQLTPKVSAAMGELHAAAAPAASEAGVEPGLLEPAGSGPPSR